MNRPSRPELTPERIAELRIRLRDPEYMQKAIDGTARMILDALMPEDKEVPVLEFPKGKHRSAE